MNQKELKELVEFIIEKGIAEFELERGDVKIKIKRTSEAVSVPVPDPRYLALHPGTSAVPTLVAPPANPLKAEPAPDTHTIDEGLHKVLSPIVGTFYEAPSPGAPPFVKAGDRVEVGQVLCIVEAMKLMNEIECDVAGEIVKKLANNGQPIEYGQELFLIRPGK